MALKLVYFPFPGRAEPSRLAMFLGNVDFEDVHVTFPEFGANKASYTFGSLPVLMKGDKMLAQSNSILRFVSKLGNAGLYPHCPWHAAKVERVQPCRLTGARWTRFWTRLRRPTE